MKSKTYLWVVAVVGLTILGVNQSRAQIVYESFSYTNGQNLSGLNGGIGFSGAWTAANPANSQIGTGSLSDGNLVVQGNDLAISGKVDSGNVGNADNLSRTLTTNLGGAGQDIWVSFLMEKTAGAGSYGGLILGTGATQVGAVSNGKGLFIGYSGAAFSIGPNGAAAGLSGGTVTTGTPQFIVANLNYTTATGGTITLYLNATPGGSLGTALGSTTFSLNSFGQIGFASLSGVLFDEIRIGDSYLSVSPIPEPAPYTLLGIGFLALILVQINRKRLLA
ncbi:MAG: hypothetical protein LBH01_06825 [Verrucomicrobiales bacterium]|jgi:hypothetical protein|nr:hypothetical protein [Verrucomicrobiales bacterium]